MTVSSDAMWHAYQAHARTERRLGRYPMDWDEWVHLASEAEAESNNDLAEGQGS